MKPICFLIKKFMKSRSTEKLNVENPLDDIFNTSLPSSALSNFGYASCIVGPCLAKTCLWVF